MLTVVKKVVGKKPLITEMSEGLQAMKEAVGGYIECVRLPYKIDMWLNEEGLLDGLPLNLQTYVEGKVVHQIVGNVFFASSNDVGDTISLNDEQATWILEHFVTIGIGVENDEPYPIHGLIVR